MAISVLPPEVVSRIAAGEVVERPASVVKELVENSLDAGASRIVVETIGGGLKLIRVTDNGWGIPSQEIELVFHRYATSKISQLKDLENISTLGFRGEALPAIAAVSQVEMLSRTSQEPAATFLKLNEGKVVERLRRGRPVGTTVTVHNLFQNFPARRKFLKSAATENAHIQNVVQAYALSFPQVQFSLYMEKRPVLHTSGSGDLRGSIAEVFGTEVLGELKEVSFSQDKLNIWGFIGLPSLTYSTRDYLAFFVNRRWVSLPKLSRLVKEAYKGLIDEDRYPFALLFLEILPGEVDVNVHPAKTEVRFVQEFKVMEAVSQALSRALGTLPRPQTPPEVFPFTLPTTLPVLRVLGQLSSSYIITEGPDGLYLIDQHTAHERIIYEKVLSQLKEQALESQGLLEPLTVELAAEEEEVLRRLDLDSFGFCLEPFGPGTYLIRAAPAIIKGEDILSALKEILRTPGQADLKAHIAATIACHGAIKAGQVLSSEEMRKLVEQVEKLPTKVCPHKRPIVLHLSASFLDREFGR